MKLDSVIVEVTERCNLACRYCYNPWKRPGAGRPLAPDSYAAARRTLGRAFSRLGVRHVTLSGGEPFLAERFPEIVLFCRLKGRTVTVISNGTAATRADYRTAIDVGVGQFELPLHSATAAAHDAMTGSPGSWARSLRSIRELLELGGKVAVAVVLTRLNREGIGDTIGFLRELGVARVMLNRFNVGGRGVSERARLAPCAAELRAAFAAADAAARGPDVRVTANVSAPHCVLDPDDYRAIRFSSCATDLAARPVALELGGGLRFCNHSPVVVGNVFADRIEDLAASPYAESWRRAVPAACAGCARWPRCLGGCRAAAEQLGGTVADVDPVALPVLAARGRAARA